MDQFVTVVSGIPRSGTSLMMRMLQAGGLPVLTDNLRLPDEHNPHGYFEDERVKRLAHDASWFTEARGKAVKVIYRLLPHLPKDIPHRILFMHRDLREVFASQNAMLRSEVDDEGLVIAAFEKDIARHRPTDTKICDVNYADVLRDPIGQSRRIVEFLELPLNTEAMAQAVDPKLYRNRAT